MRRAKPTALLPAFVEPMLALPVEPFESDAHQFELKWDGFRALCFADAARVRLAGRRKTDFAARFPELSVLAGLPRGTVLDGEIVHLTRGKPDFQALLARERSYSSASEATRARPSRCVPVTFVAFDLLYARGAAVLHEPLADRRRRLEDLLAKAAGPRLQLSEARVGGGLELFAHVNELGLEGVVAKRLDGAYEPGRRSGSWSKFKRRRALVCAVVGYLPSTTGGIKSLLLVADVGGEPTFVGLVGGGIPSAVHRDLLDRFGKLAQRSPVVSCSIAGARWLRPELFCRVTFMEWTAGGKLRSPVFERLL